MAIISTLVCASAGYLYPAYKSYKILKYSPKDASRILVYWIVIGAITVCQIITDKVLFWFPFYSEIKAIFILWLILPATNGYQVIFNKFILTFLNKYEKQIDSGYDTIKYLIKNKFIEVNQKLWVIIQERIFNNIEPKKNVKENNVVSASPNQVPVVEPVVKPKLIENVNVKPNTPSGTSPAYQRKTIVVPNSPTITSNNGPMGYKSPSLANKSNLHNEITSFNSNSNNVSNYVNKINSNSNTNNNTNNNTPLHTPLLKNVKKVPAPSPLVISNNNMNNMNNMNSNINNNHISDKYQRIRAYKEQLLDVLSQLEKDEEKEIRQYTKNNNKLGHHRNKSSISSGSGITNNPNINSNNNNNIISSKLNKNKDNDFEYSLNERDYEAILSDSKAFIKSNGKTHSSITNFLKNFKSSH